MRRPSRALAVGGVAVLAVAALLVGCTVPADQEGRRPDEVTGPSPSGPGSGPILDSVPSITRPATPDERPVDVPDRTFPGLGDPRIDVASYAVTVKATPGQDTISGRVTIELTPVGDRDLTGFTLDLRGPRISTATVDGRRSAVLAEQKQVFIQPPTPLPAGHPATVVIAYAGTPDQSLFPALGIPVGWQRDQHGGWFTMSEPNGTSTWVPVSDHPSDKATWTVTLDTPAGVTGVSNGHLVSKVTAGGRTRWRWHEDQPMASYLVLAAVGSYDLVSHTHGDRHDLFAFPTDLSAAKRAGFDALDPILDYFTQVFGPLPGSTGPDGDDEGAVVVDDDLGVALETQSRPLFGTDSVHDGDTGALAHELGHQWFGDSVTLSTWPDEWLNEGFATYADWLWRDHIGEIHLDQQAAQVAEQYAGVGLTVRDPTAAATFDEVVYNRGALTLQALRKTVGDATFFEILRTWVRRYGGRSASTAQFAALSSKLAGRDLTDFFHRWLDAVPQPALPR